MTQNLGFSLFNTEATDILAEAERTLSMIEPILLLLDLKGRIVVPNQRAKTLFRTERIPLTGKYVHRLPIFSPTSRAQELKDLRLIMAGKTAPYRVHQLAKHRGTIGWVESSWLPIDRQGKTIAILKILRDITLQKNLEEQLAFHQTVLTQTLESMKDGVLVLDLEGKAILHNQNFIDIYGLPKNFFHRAPDDRDRLVAFISSHAKDPERFVRFLQAVYRQKYRLRQYDLTLRNGVIAEHLYAPLTKPNHQWIGRLWFVRDITRERELERDISTNVYNLKDEVAKRTALLTRANKNLIRSMHDEQEAERSVAQSADRFRGIFENSPILMIVVDRIGRIIDANDQLQRWLGYLPAEVRGKMILKMPFFDAITRKNLATKIAMKRPPATFDLVEQTFVTKKHRRVAGSLKATRLTDSRELPVGYLLMVTDVTQGATAKKELKHQILEIQKTLAGLKLKP